MITKELRMAACEVNQILRYTDINEVNKIPVGLRLFFKEIADESYIPDLRPELSLYDQKVMDKTKDLLGMIYCFYWSSEEDLDKLPNDVKTEAKEAGKEIFENYSQEEFFENAKERRKNSLENQALIETPKLPWYKKILAWFKRK